MKLFTRTLIAVLVLALTGASDTAPASQSQTGSLSCSEAVDVMRVALSTHVSHERMSELLAKRTLEQYEKILLSHKEFLSPEDVRAIREKTNSVKPSRIALQLQSANCEFFEDQADNLRRAVDQAAAELPRHAEKLKTFEQKRRFHRLARLSKRMRDFATVYMLKAFMLSLDPHSAFLDEQETDDFFAFFSAGKRAGVGLWLGESGEHGIEITRFTEGSPAEKSGRIRLGDRLVRVNGVSVVGMAVEQAGELLLGSEDSVVKIQVQRMKGKERAGRVRTVKLTRTLLRSSDDGQLEFEFQKVRGRNVLTARLLRFYAGCANDLYKGLKDNLSRYGKEGGVHALVLDLRDNLGGLADEAGKVAGIFITTGPVVGLHTRQGESVLHDMDKLKYEGAVVVAVNERSASSSEIVAGTLKDYDRALIVGSEHTYGKGTAMLPMGAAHGIHKGSAVVTFTQYYTPQGNSPQLTGVKSHITVPGPELRNFKMEADLPYAIPNGKFPSVLTFGKYRENAEPFLKEMISPLGKLSQKRVAQLGGRLDSEQQLNEIRRVAADYAALREKLASGQDFQP